MSTPEDPCNCDQALDLKSKLFTSQDNLISALVKLDMVRQFLRSNITHNLEHCESSHRYNNGACLLCNAEELMKEIDENQTTAQTPEEKVRAS